MTVTLILSKYEPGVQQMDGFQNLPIRKKLLYSILSFTLLLVFSVTAVVGVISYNTMKSQLINNRRMSIGWLQERLDLEMRGSLNQFYKFEVDQDIRDHISKWQEQGTALDYQTKNELIRALNTIISIDSNINAIELYNYDKDRVLVAQRSKSEFADTRDRLSLWKERDPNLQTNLVFQKADLEIILSHQIYDSYNNKPTGLVSFRLRRYKFQDMLERIRANSDESIYLLNDENQLIEADYGDSKEVNSEQVNSEQLREIVDRLENNQIQEIEQDGNFWFYRAVNNGKLKILFAVPSATIVKSLTDTLLAGGIIAVISAVVTILGSIALSNIISRPIIAFSDKMRTLMIDDYSDEGFKTREDEIGILQGSFSMMIERNQKLITQEYQSQIEKRNAQISALQAQINPHFMYNTLQTIGGMALSKDAPQVYVMTTSLSDMMRYSLNFSKEMVPLREEIKYLQAYLIIQNERFGDRIELEIVVDKESLEYMIPKLILQPLLENSLEHGLAEKKGKWNICLRVWRAEEQDLVMEMHDNGVGIPSDRLRYLQEMLKKDAESALKTGAHIGLRNVDSRIRLMFPDQRYGVTIESEVDMGTTVKVVTKMVKEQRRHADI